MPSVIPRQLNSSVVSGHQKRQFSTPRERVVKKSRTARSFSKLCARVNRYEVGLFRPAVRNGHLQTILGHLRPAPEVEYVRHEVESEDGWENLQVDVAGDGRRVENKGADKACVLVLHGLESNSEGKFTREIVGGLVKEGWTVAVLNNRGCGPNSFIRGSKSYHAGFVEDARTVLKWVAERFRGPVYLVGFSLGASMVLNLLGKESVLVEKCAVGGAVCISVPWDPAACQSVIDSGINRVIYSMRFVKSIQAKIRKSVERGVDYGCDIDKIMKAKTIGEIDDYYISPVFGFKDRFDYYHKVDARKMLKYITTPTLCLSARDDPFFAHRDMKSLPTKAMIGEAPVRVVVHETGGHCGWVEVADMFGWRPAYCVREIVRFLNHLK